MAEIEFTLPTVQYGNVKIRATAEELGIQDGVADAAAVGVAAAVYLTTFTQGFKLGAQIDVDINPQINGQPLKGAHEASVEELREQLGATVVEEVDYTPDPTVPDDEPEDDDNVPAWDKPVAAQPKVWETGSKPPVQVAEIDWS